MIWNKVKVVFKALCPKELYSGLKCVCVRVIAHVFSITRLLMLCQVGFPLEILVQPHQRRFGVAPRLLHYRRHDNSWDVTGNPFG